MLQLFDLNHVKLYGLTNYKDLKRERTLDGEEILSFLYPQPDSKYGSIQEEAYLRTKDNEYVVKEINIDDDWTGFVAKINVENLKGNVIERFESIEQTVTDCLNLALVSTGWTVGSCDVTKKRTVRMSRKSTYDIIQEARKIYRCDYKFDAINKKIYIYASMGTDKGSYFSEELNLKKLNVQSNSYDYCTRVIPIGKDGLQINDINDGKQYVENHQYSNKIITVYWEDNRYTVVESLKEDAIARLNELSKPVKSYKAEIFDLARLNDKYKNILDYDLGDTITLLSKDKKVRDKQRIVKIIEYPEEPERNTCEIANRIMSLEDLQVEFEEAADTVDTITTSDGGLDGSKIDSVEWTKVKNVSIYTADIQDMNVVFGRIGTLETTTAHITNGVIDNATIDVAKVNNLSSTYATITNLNAVNANLQTVTGDVASIKNVLAGHVGADNLAAGAIQAGSAIIANGAISSAQIASLDVGKLNAGDISTTKFRIVSSSGNMLLSDNTIQIKDASRVRVQIGKDASNDYNMYVWDTSGNLMFDATGLKASGIKSKIIVDNMVSDTANINGSKLEKESLIVQINGATTTLKSSRVKLDTENQTLDVAFTSLKSTVTSQGNTITSQGTSISTIQGQISSKIWQTDIDSSINNLNTMTKLNGEELISQNFKKGVDDKPFTNGSYSLVNNILASPIAEQYVIKVTNSTFLRSDFIPFDLSRPFYTMITSFNEATTNGVLYIGVEFYDKDKVSLGSNDLVIYSISADTTALPVNTWKTFEGYVNVSSTDSTRLKAAYIRLRILTRWSGNTGVTYLKDISLKQLGSQVLPSTVTRITTAESNINQLNTSISLKVDTSTFNSYKTSNDGAVSSLTSRVSSAELKITDSAIVLTVRNSTAYQNDLSGKVGNSEIISKINQTAEAIKIQANKIDLTGYVTINSLSSTGSVTINCGNISGGTLTLGGAGNGNGWVSLKNASNVTMVSLDNTGLYNSSGTFKVTDSKVYFANAEIADFMGGQTTDMYNVTRPGFQVNINKIKLRDFNLSARYGPDGTGELYTLNVWNDSHAFTITQESFDRSDTLSNYQEIFRVSRGGAFALGSRIMYDRGSDTTDPMLQIKDPANRNGICARYGDGPVGYNYGALITMSSSGPRFQMYAPHNEGGVSALYFRTGWNDDIKDWKRIATYGDRGYFNGIDSTSYIYTDRILGRNSRSLYVGDGSDGTRIDAGSGGFRLYTSWYGNSDYGLRINSSGGIDVLVNNSTKFSVSSSGSKVGGTYTLDGIDYGMSPVDSPRSLIEDVYIDIDVFEEGTTIELDVLLARMIDKYAVFVSNTKVEVVSKDKGYFTVKGYTGKVDIRIIGIRKDCVDQYFPIMNDLVA